MVRDYDYARMTMTLEWACTLRQIIACRGVAGIKVNYLLEMLYRVAGTLRTKYLDNRAPVLRLGL